MSVPPRAARIWAPAPAFRTPARRANRTRTFNAADPTTTGPSARKRVPQSAAPRAAWIWAPARASRIRACLRRAARFSTDLKDGAQGRRGEEAVDLLVPLIGVPAAKVAVPL